MLDNEVKNFFNDMSTEEWLHLAFQGRSQEYIEVRLIEYFDGRPLGAIQKISKLIYKQLHPKGANPVS